MQAQNDFVICIEQQREEKKGGLYLPGDTKGTGIFNVVSAGPDVEGREALIGQMVFFDKREGRSFEVQDQEFFAIRAEDIVCTF